MDHTGDGFFVTSDTTNLAYIDLGARVREHWNDLSRTERAVGKFLTARTVEWLLYASAADLGAESGTSNATVVRTLQRLGYRGLSDFKHTLATSFSSSVAAPVRLQQRIARIGASLPSITTAVLEEAAEQITLLRDLIQHDSLADVVNLLTSTPGTVHTYGVGLSGLSAEFLAMQLTRAGRHARHLAQEGLRFADMLLGLRSGDPVIVFAPGRLTVELSVLLEHSRDVGAPVVLITDELEDSLRDLVTISLQAPDSPTGTTSELMTAMLVCTILVQAVTAVDQTRAVETSHTLITLREALGY